MSDRLSLDPMRAAGTNYSQAPLRKDERLAAVTDYCTTKTAAGQPIHVADIAAHLRCSVAYAAKELRRAVAAGTVVKLAGRDGWIATAPLAPATRRVTLRDLLELARRRASTAASPHRGRRALHVSHDIHEITPGQLGDIERLVSLIVRHAPHADGDSSRVGDGAFGWDAQANNGRGGWSLCAKVRDWAEREHQQKYDARGARAGQRPAWRPGLALATVRDYQGATSNLLHLAATAGLISRSPMARGGAAGTLYAPCWVPIIERVVRWIGVHADAANPRRRYVGARTLAIVATQLGGRSLRSTDWIAVRARLDEARRSESIPQARYEAARYVWRAVMEAIRARLAVAPAVEWPLDRDQRVTLVSSAGVRLAAKRDVPPASRDFAEWTAHDGRPAEALIEGEYGIRAYVAWSTLDALALRAAHPTLPQRKWRNESSVAGPRRAGKAPQVVSDATMQTRLYMLSRLAGYAARECGVDWTTADLRTLVNPMFLSGYVEWARALPPDGRRNGHSQLADTIKAMAWLCNGFLSAQAQRLGDDEWVATLAEWYHAAEALARDLETEPRQSWQITRARVVAVADAWRGYDGIDGLMKVNRLQDALERDLSAAARGRSVSEQRAAILEGSWRPGLTWARTLRLLCVLRLAVRVPLRANSAVQMTLDMWESSPVGPAQQAAAMDRRLPRWDGALALNLPAGIMKSRRPFRPALVLPEHVAVAGAAEAAAHDTLFRRDLWELWFMAGGGRDICRTVRNPQSGATELLDVPWVFPDNVRAESFVTPSRRGKAKKGPRTNRGTTARDGLWSRSSLSAMFTRAVRRHARELCVDVAKLKSTRGALGFHALRRLFGTHWASKNLVWCSRLLDHTSVEFTLRVYVGEDERTMSLTVGVA